MNKFDAGKYLQKLKRRQYINNKICDILLIILSLEILICVLFRCLTVI